MVGRGGSGRRLQPPFLRSFLLIRCDLPQSCLLQSLQENSPPPQTQRPGVIFRDSEEVSIHQMSQMAKLFSRSRARRQFVGCSFS